VGAFDAGEFFGGEHLWEREAAEGETTDAEHVAAGDPVAEASGGRTEEIQHGIEDAMVSGGGCGKLQCVPLCVGAEGIPLSLAKRLLRKIGLAKMKSSAWAAHLEDRVAAKRDFISS
jgi:hypothetical protein